MRLPRLSVAHLTALALALVLPRPAAGQDHVQANRRPNLPGLHHESVAFDAGRGRLVVVFGAGDSLKGTWEWDGRAWTMVADSASSPTWRYGATMGYDPSGRRLLLFGGWLQYPRAPSGFQMFCDTWAFDGGRWSRLSDGPCFTTRVRNNSLVYDTRRRSMLLVDGTPEIPGDSVRALRLWRWAGSQWSLVDSLGPRRSGWNRAVYDESRSALVMPVFEGPDAGVWEWNGERWRKVVADGPSPRHVHALQYDPRRQRVVLVGGQTLERPTKYLGDAWTWDGVRWSPLPVSDGPSARAGAALLDDPANGRLLYFGGYAGPPMQLSQELWFLDSAGWRLWKPLGSDS
jgi:hypothetical protein